jgi:hypothetical protein
MEIGCSELVLHRVADILRLGSAIKFIPCTVVKRRVSYSEGCNDQQISLFSHLF